MTARLIGPDHANPVELQRPPRKPQASEPGGIGRRFARQIPELVDQQPRLVDDGVDLGGSFRKLDNIRPDPAQLPDQVFPEFGFPDRLHVPGIPLQVAAGLSERHPGRGIHGLVPDQQPPRPVRLPDDVRQPRKRGVQVSHGRLLGAPDKLARPVRRLDAPGQPRADLREKTRFPDLLEQGFLVVGQFLDPAPGPGIQHEFQALHHGIAMPLHERLVQVPVIHLLAGQTPLAGGIRQEADIGDGPVPEIAHFQVEGSQDVRIPAGAGQPAQDRLQPVCKMAQHMPLAVQPVFHLFRLPPPGLGFPEGGPHPLGLLLERLCTLPLFEFRRQRRLRFQVRPLRGADRFRIRERGGGRRRALPQRHPLQLAAQPRQGPGLAGITGHQLQLNQARRHIPLGLRHVAQPR